MVGQEKSAVKKEKREKLLFHLDLSKQPTLTFTLRVVLMVITREQDVFSLLVTIVIVELEDTQTRDPVFCFACRHFVPSDSRRYQ